MEFDCIIIGKGLIGSAAAKYISLSGEGVAVIGPDEPLDAKKATVFASHYDQARIQRIIGKDATWTLLNKQSAAEYSFIQKETGITFHSPVGCLYVNPHGRDAYIEQLPGQSKKCDSAFEFLKNGNLINKTFPDFHFPETSIGMCEGAPSGFINPRLLVKAQLEIFKKNNGTIFNDVICNIEYENNSIKITSQERNIFRAKKVLVAAGAFTNSLQLLHKKLAFGLKSETVLWAKLSEEDALRLKELPSLLYEIDIPEIQNIYLVQPVQYPDGNYYIKMGANLINDIYFENLIDIQNWFCSGDSDCNKEILKDAFNLIMPRINVKEYFTQRCIVTSTPHRKPYIGTINDKGLFVAAGGNGYSAMCSDALGRTAAYLLINNSFPEEYNAEEFKPLFIN